MGKISKSDQDPNQVDKDRIAISEILSKRSQHFALGARVVCRNIGGTITRISKDGGTKLIVEWDNGTSSVVDNPHQRRR